MLSNYLPPVYFPFGEEEEKEPIKVYTCSQCGRDICVGDEFWAIGEKTYCEKCINAAFDIADA